MASRSQLTSWMLPVVFLFSGCFVKEEVGKQMQADIAALQVEFEVVKKAHAEQKAELQKRLEEADTRIAELVKIIEEYQRSMGRNAADIGVDLEKIKSQLMELRGRLEVGEHRLDSMERKVSVSYQESSALQAKSTSSKEGKISSSTEPVISKPPKSPASQDPLAAIKRPEKAEDFYKLAYSMLDAGQTEAARTLFDEFVNKWPSNAYTDNAMYWIAESYYAEKKFRQAALTFQQVRSQFPKGDKAGDALLKLGYCFFAMEKYKEAIPFLGEFVQSYPKNPQVAAAKKKLQEAQQLSKKTSAKNK